MKSEKRYVWARRVSLSDEMLTYSHTPAEAVFPFTAASTHHGQLVKSNQGEQSKAGLLPR